MVLEALINRVNKLDEPNQEKIRIKQQLFIQIFESELTYLKNLIFERPKLDLILRKHIEFKLDIYLIAIEKTPPYAVGVHVLSEIYIKHAEKRMFQTLEKMKNAETSQDFSTGWPEINQVHLPAWMEDDMDDAAF